MTCAVAEICSCLGAAASQNGHLEVVQALIHAKANVNDKAADGVTALMIASQNGHLETVRTLLAAKADVNAKDVKSGTALVVASEQGRLETVRTLLGANADVNAKTADGFTALIQASQNGHLVCLRKWPPGCGAGLGRLERRCERQGGQWRNGVEFGDKGRLRGDSAAPESVASPVNNKDCAELICASTIFISLAQNSLDFRTVRTSGGPDAANIRGAVQQAARSERRASNA
jgi:ankyrin repeat protein